MTLLWNNSHFWLYDEEQGAAEAAARLVGGLYQTVDPVNTAGTRYLRQPFTLGASIDLVEVEDYLPAFTGTALIAIRRQSDGVVLTTGSKVDPSVGYSRVPVTPVTLPPDSYWLDVDYGAAGIGLYVETAAPYHLLAVTASAGPSYGGTFPPPNGPLGSHRHQFRLYGSETP